MLASLGYASLCGLVWWKQTSLMFFPSRELLATPKDAGLQYEQWWLEVEPGVRLSAWKMAGKQGQPWVLVCHGNGGNISHRLELAHRLHELGLGVVLFDYRGYGQSSGQLHRESDLLADAQAVYDRLVGDSGQPPILYGESLGGGVAALLAEKKCLFWPDSPVHLYSIDRPGFRHVLVLAGPLVVAISIGYGGPPAPAAWACFGHAQSRR